MTFSMNKNDRFRIIILNLELKNSVKIYSDAGRQGLSVAMSGIFPIGCIILAILYFVGLKRETAPKKRVADVNVD
jgi:hypothetical protein